MIERWLPEKYIHGFFLVSILVKGFDGIVEILTGMILFFPHLLKRIVNWMLHSNFLTSVHFLAAHKQALHSAVLNHDGLFATIYLLSHGVIKIFLVGGLWYRKLWAYPTAIVVFIAFVIYQVYRYAVSPSMFMIVLTILDLIVIGLTWHEYKFLKNRAQVPGFSN